MKHPKEIQKIIDNQGKTAKKVEKEMEQSIIDMEKADREADRKLRELLGC